MTKEDILNWWYTPNSNINPFIYVKDNEQIIEIYKGDLFISRQMDGFVDIISYPGPKYNLYKFDDYGNSWAFSGEELKNAKNN